jgi:hypothetical protein
MTASLKLGLICVSSCSMARTTEYEYKKKSGLESRDPGIGERSGFQSRDSKSFGIDTTSRYVCKCIACDKGKGKSVPICL